MNQSEKAESQNSWDEGARGRESSQDAGKGECKHQALVAGCSVGHKLLPLDQVERLLI